MTQIAKAPMIAMAARIASRVSRRSLAAMSACLARAIEGRFVFVVVVVHGSAPFLIVGLFVFLIVGLLDCLHVRLPACNQV